jgi:hypothetical protein
MGELLRWIGIDLETGIGIGITAGFLVLAFDLKLDALDSGRGSGSFSSALSLDRLRGDDELPEEIGDTALSSCLLLPRDGGKVLEARGLGVGSPRVKWF